MSSNTPTTTTVVASEKAGLLSAFKLQQQKKPAPPLLPLHTGDLRDIELARAEAVWEQSERCRPMLIVIYIAAFLFLFQFLAGTTFVSAILEEIKVAQVPQAFP